MNNNDLSIEKKLAALTSRRIWEEEGAEEAMAIAEMRDIAMSEDDLVVPYESIADSWDSELARQIVGLVAARARANGAGGIILPPLAPKSGLSSHGVSEDVFHICKLAAAECEGARSAGVRPIIGRFGIESDMLIGDSAYDRKAIAETFLKPLFAMKKDGALPAVVYEESDDEKFGLSELIRQTVGKPEYEFCLRAKANDTIRQIVKGRRVIYGDTLFAADAYADWKYYQRQLIKSAISEAKIRFIAKNGSIIGDDSIEETYATAEAYDERCRNTYPTERYTDRESEILHRLAEESVVLLKNKATIVGGKKQKRKKVATGQILPLSRGIKLAVVGHCLAEDFYDELTKSGVVYSKIDGYDYKSEERVIFGESDREKVNSADVVLYFIDNSRAHGRIAALPSNRLAVLSELSALGKPIIAIAIGKSPIDMRFDDKCDGVFLARGNCKYLGNALVKLIFGDANPSGRLSVSCFNDTDERFMLLKRDELLTGTKKGTFFGYKYYDGSGESVKYPFGYGLSYGSCRYTIVQGDSAGIKVKLTNTTSKTICETVQVYAEELNPVKPRAKKELIGFIKVKLEGGKETTAYIGFPDSIFASYSVEEGGFVSEKGKYVIYVGSSCLKTKSKASLEVGRKTALPSKRKIAEFLSWKPNIVSDGYTIEEGENLMKNSKKITIISWIMLIASLMYDIVAFVLWVKEDFYFGLYDISSLIIVSMLVVSNLIIIITLAVLSNLRKRNKEVEKLLVKLKADKFADATIVESDESNEIFKKVEVGYEAQAYEDTSEDEYTRSLSFDKDKKMSQICIDLKKYLTERGFSLQMDEVRSIVAAFASSKLIITEGSTLRKNAIIASCEFFGKLFETMVMGEDENSIFKNNYVKAAIEHAKTSRDEMVFCVLKNMNAQTCNDCFNKLMAYFASSESGKRIFYDNNGKEEAVYIPSNLWVLTILDDNVALSLMSHVVGRSAVLLPEVNQCDRATVFTPFDKLGFNQLVMMVDVAGDKTFVAEDEWKFVDKIKKEIEPFGFALDNKNWQVFEKFAAVFVASEGSEMAMIDYLVSILLLPGILKYNADLLEKGKSLKAIRNDLFEDFESDKSEVVLKELTKFEKQANTSFDGVEGGRNTTNRAEDTATNRAETTTTEKLDLNNGTPFNQNFNNNNFGNNNFGENGFNNNNFGTNQSTDSEYKPFDGTGFDGSGDKKY